MTTNRRLSLKILFFTLLNCIIHLRILIFVRLFPIIRFHQEIKFEYKSVNFPALNNVNWIELNWIFENNNMNFHDFSTQNDDQITVWLDFRHGLTADEILIVLKLHAHTTTAKKLVASIIIRHENST